MKRQAITTTLAVLLSAACAVAADVVLDAAKMDRYAVEFTGFAAVRSVVTAEANDLTAVRFDVEIHGGTLGNVTPWGWADTNNPWYGARGVLAIRADGASYDQGFVYYPPQRQWAPHFSVDPTPGSPGSGDEYELFDVVPAGMTWDVCIKLEGWLGGDIDLFSTAAGEMSSDQLTVGVTDTDPMPQTIPEPASLILLLVGTAVLLRRRV